MLLLLLRLQVLLLFCMLPSPGSQGSVRNNLRTVEEFLKENCVDIASFVPQICGQSPLGPECCGLFTIVGICSPSCVPKGASAMEQLQSLQSNVALCAALRQTEQTMCQQQPMRASQQCQSLLCLNNMMCQPFYDFACFNNTRENAAYRGTPGVQRQESPRKACRKSTPVRQEPVRTTHSFIRDNCYGLPEVTDSEMTGLVSEEDSELSEVHPDEGSKLDCSDPINLQYRTIDGSCNNLQNPRWGKSFEPQKRLLPPSYIDNNMPQNRARSGKSLPLARTISRAVSPMGDFVSSVSNMVMAWGQFIDHDISGTPMIKNGTKTLKCCSNIPRELKVENGGPCDPLEIPEGDPLGVSCMNFVRSLPLTFANGTLAVPRQQLNALSSYVDASAVYGSTKDELKKLRGENGKMKVTDQNMLPENKKGTCKKEKEGDYCLLAGDKRVNVFVGLGVLHTVFVREHNRIATAFRSLNPSWSSETIFQEARRIISAQLQHITYAEWLPMILNRDTMRRYSLKSGGFRYDPWADATVANVFSTAAFRFGHSQIKQLVKVEKALSALQDTLMRTGSVLRNMAGVVRGLISEPTDEVERFFAVGLTNHMFETSPNAFDGLDLVAVNIKRGRDHGLPSFNEWREHCGLPRIRDFATSEMTTNLGSVYEHPDDVDAFMGMVTEQHMPGSLVGPTLACLLGEQFRALKVGDRFFYETRSPSEGFTEDQLKEIKKVSLAKVLCQTVGIDEIQRDVFQLPNYNTNPVEKCKKLPSMNLSKWRSRRGGPYHVK